MIVISKAAKLRLFEQLVSYLAEIQISDYDRGEETAYADAWESGLLTGKFNGMEYALRALFGPDEKHGYYALDNELKEAIDAMVESAGVRMYAETNFKTKKAFKEAVKAGRGVRLWSPGLGVPKRDGVEYVEGPWHPEAHKWYARVEVVNGKVVKVS